MLNISTHVLVRDFEDADCIELDVKNFIKSCRYKLIGTKTFIYDGKLYTIIIYTNLNKKIIKIEQ